MKRLVVLTSALVLVANAIGCNCFRGRGAPCAPVCAPSVSYAPACAPACSPCSGSTSYSGGMDESYIGTPTPAGTISSPGPVTYTPSPN